ncbi:Anaphase-promoting complex subunit 4 [Hondaea fermentalgiana]|uniref:Anaphase-promoting complex subunit 4 n=1 Tax=Hondaea fermentalgiana TaxID=2315210 RepID=A0A2R5G454_9STRA|nr:Anaphase-promoting complex subunit 4 [Hondaea fermentalgiana]|eukprot:GBG25089.1 Anaphase-promoting complex subunit 4 [Hondaea fermentalgiana]
MASFDLLQDRSVPLTKAPGGNNNNSSAQTDYALGHEGDESVALALRQASCCPVMDLVALANGHQMVVQRSIKWERVFLAACGVSCLAWRPDGKALGVGQEDGAVALFDVENGEEYSLAQNARPHKKAIVAMTWAAQESRSNGPDAVPKHDFQDRAALLPEVDMGQLLGFKSYASALMDMPLFGVENKSRETLEVLVSGDTSGVVTLGAFGYFPVGCIDLAGAFRQPANGNADSTPSVRLVKLSRDMQTLLTVLQRGEELRVVTVDTSLLAERSDELRHVAAQYGHIGELIAFAEKALQEMSKAWASATTALRNHLEPLQQQLDNFQRPNTAEQELFMMLTCGVTSLPLQHYIDHIQEHSLMRLAKALDTACATMEDTCTRKLARAAEALVFRLEDLHGLARWEERFAIIGLRKQTTQQLLSASQQLLLKSQEVLALTRDARANFAAYSVWLQTVWFKTNQHRRSNVKHIAHVDIDRLVRLLSRQLLHPHVSEHFDTAKLSSADSSPIYSTASLHSITNDSLRAVLGGLQKTWDAAFHMTSDAVSGSFRPTDNKILPRAHPRRVDVGFAEDGSWLAALAADGAQDRIALISKDGASRDITLPTVKLIHDLRFYRPDDLLITYEDKEGRRALAQVSLSSVDPSSEDGPELRSRLLQPANRRTTGLICQASRGVALVFVDNGRLQLFDIDNDEGDDDDDDDDEEEEEEEENDEDGVLARDA